MKELEETVKSVVKELFDTNIDVSLTRPDPQFGDYATNVALQLAKQLSKSPRDVASMIVGSIKHPHIANLEVAGPGFINITLVDHLLIEQAMCQPTQSMAGKVVLAEYSDPNPFKVLHAGHVYTTVVGDSIANLLASAGADVHRVNYGGDVGMHVAKTMWAILQRLGGEFPEKLRDIKIAERSVWMSSAYVEGNNIFEANEDAKNEITDLNKRVYQLHADADKDSPFARIYWKCRQWSYDAFDAFYKRLGTQMERYYPESEVADIGLSLVKEQVGKVFEESEGAIIFRGEKFGLHTRVFVNKKGIPTYEAKEIGLIVKKYKDYNYDLSVIVTANEQEQYMAVLSKAIEQFLPDLAALTRYVPHGMVKLDGGVKMSSRRGNIIPALEVIDATILANKELNDKDDELTVLGAIKYSFLKNRIGGDIIYDPVESVALEGNSGPYLQYAHARARSILRKADNVTSLKNVSILDAQERIFAQKLSEYSETVEKATEELMPHHICTYLYELAQVFNRFYEKNRVLGDDRESTRLSLMNRYTEILQQGLGLLGIVAPESM